MRHSHSKTRQRSGPGGEAADRQNGDADSAAEAAQPVPKDIALEVEVEVVREIEIKVIESKVQVLIEKDIQKEIRVETNVWKPTTRLRLIIAFQILKVIQLVAIKHTILK